MLLMGLLWIALIGNCQAQLDLRTNIAFDELNPGEAAQGVGLNDVHLPGILDHQGLENKTTLFSHMVSPEPPRYSG